MGYGGDGISFNVLRAANQARQKAWPGSEKCDVEFRTIEVAGEAGEVAEKVKKFLRKQRGIQGRTATTAEIATEMGDLLVSLDLLANELGIDLNDAVRDAFNKTSIEHKMDIFLGTNDWRRA